ncbi:MAG TPA: 30S ribosomal protein S2 [Deltaproteobacteria bacterium]|nr:30S ribosomal protein S2 [Deltaproteobacteria bacterium]
MTSVSMQDLLEAGMHFGHLTRRWNPKMKPYIYGVRHGVHIIDLSKTVKMLNTALGFITEAVGNGADILFVGTKKQSQDVIEEEAKRCGMYFVNNRWLGGTLTNFRTIKASIDRLKDLQKKKEDGTFAVLSKKEILMIDREIERYQRSLGGIQDMTRLPGVMVVIDPTLERIALHEAGVLGIPVVALGDTNCDPDAIDYLVPGNDDALRSIKLFVAQVADQVLEGMRLREIQARRAPQEKVEEEKPAVREAKGEKAAAWVGRRDEKAEEEEIEEGSYSARVEPETPTESEEE